VQSRKGLLSREKKKDLGRACSFSVDFPTCALLASYLLRSHRPTEKEQVFVRRRAGLRRSRS
jgi:hypothetical protein